ncbi:MAG: hypothetical protein MR598_05330 [Erysipelotrichaceae bacterium]|nr:hypothetical protein [Erysipelotrichaceae bacterium]
MKYKYSRMQVFGKRLKVPKEILMKVYNCTLSFNEFIEYKLDDKIPTSCIIDSDRQIVEKFGLEKSKQLDWELLNKRIYYNNINLKETLMRLDENTTSLNESLYEMVKNEIRPSDYSKRMQTFYPNRLFTISENNDDNLNYEKSRFNDGEISLKNIIYKWNLYKDKDLSYCLLKDSNNNVGIDDNQLKKFMNEFGDIANLILENTDIYSFFNDINNAKDENERQNIVKKVTDVILDKTLEKNSWNRIELTNNQYRQIFNYSSMEDYLKKGVWNEYEVDNILKELQILNLTEDFLFSMPIPFTMLKDTSVLHFIGTYGLKNVVDFDNECEHFFTNNNCEMLRIMDDMYMQYGINVHNPLKTIFTKNSYDENGNYVDRPYTKDEFYEAMKRMIVYGPTNGKYADKAPDYRKMTGEFKVRNQELFISDDAPEELQKLFYTKSITPQHLVEHPEYIPYLKDKDLSSCFKSRLVYVKDSDNYYENLYNFINQKTDFNSAMNFITEYSDIIEIVFDSRRSDSYQYEIKFSIEDNVNEIQKRINESFRRLIIEKSIAYPKNIPQSLIANYPSMFLSSNAPQELKESFYNRTISSEFILSNPSYRQYLENVDLEILFKYMPVNVINQNQHHEQINLVNGIREVFGVNDTLDVMILYGKYIEKVFEDNGLHKFNFNPNCTKDNLLDELDKIIFQNIIDGNMKYDANMPSHFKNNNPTLFLSQNVPQNIQDKFYNREFTLEDFNKNPELMEMFENANITCGFSENMSWMIPLFGNSNNLKMANYNRLKVISEFSKIYDFNHQNAFKQYIIKHLNDFNIENIEEFEYILNNIKNYENIKKYIASIKDKKIDILFKDLLEIFSYSNSNWIVDSIKVSDTISYMDILKIISLYENIDDVSLQNEFKGYVMGLGNNIEIEKIEYVSEVLSRLSLSNSSEIFTFRKELATQILKSNNPLESLSKIEDVFIRNNIPTVGKIYSCFEFLHPDFQGFNFDNSMVSPVLKKASTTSKKIVVFSDLIKASFGSNNRSVNDYLRNIEVGSNLYESIKSSKIQYDTLSEIEQKELITFSRHLATMYNNTMNAKKGNETFIYTGNVLTDILELSKKLSPDGTLDYNLDDRVIRMFCGFTGIDTLEQAKEYIDKKVKTADSRNRNAANSEMILEQGDFVKGIGNITYLRNILQNGSVSKEYLGSSAGSDATPLDTDVSMITESEGTIREKMSKTAANEYGPIWFVLKNDDRFITTRTTVEALTDEALNKKRDMSKMEVFYTGFLGKGHYGIRTGFASSEINYIVMENYDPRVGLEIAMNGFYIPVANKEGKIVFPPNDYDKLREKMNGLSYYGINEYQFDSSIGNINFELENILNSIDSNIEETKKKSDLIYSNISTKLQELNLSLTDKIDLKNKSVTLFNTGSTGRFTNLPGDGDFDFIMQVDREIFNNATKMQTLRQAIIDSFGISNHGKYDLVNGDIREFKTVVIDNNGVEHNVEIDITFVTKTDKTEYASDVCVSDRLNSISSNNERKLAKANIILAKKLLKGINAYKPARKDESQGGMGGIGVENWILQNGGTLYSAAKSFIENANQCNNFDEFKTKYALYNFGINHMAEKRGQYPHDNYIENMNSTGYEKMKQGLSKFIKLYEANVDEPCLETIKIMAGENRRVEDIIVKKSK